MASVYGLIIILILFFILLYPGISKPGSVLAITSEPFGAAVRVDGVYMAASPCNVFVPRGIHRIEAVLPGFEPYSAELKIKSRVFASLLAPLKVPFRAELKPLNPGAAFTAEAAGFAAWTFAGEPTASYQVPLSLSEGVYRLGPAASDSMVYTAMDNTLKASARFAVTRSSLRDLVRAKFLFDNQGLSPSPLSLISSGQDILDFLGTRPGSAAWLADTLQDAAGSEIAGSSWYKEEVNYASAPADSRGAIKAGPSILNLSFREISGGEFVQAGAFPHKAKVDGFYLAETEITPAAWDLFLAENPKWRQENTAELVKQGLVSSDYLKAEEFQSLNGSSPEDAGIPGISWHAARAFCQWFTAKLPPAYSQWEARLPTEAEWEYAAKAGMDMSGAYWEWCENSFAPLDFFPDPASITDSLSPEKSVRGGAWINSSGSVTAETRGSLPPYSCSAFVSFRPILAAKP